PDRTLIRDRFWPVMKRIIRTFMEGTRFGIGMDARGLLHAGDGKNALTWMDAMVGGIPVTPRNGYPVEINALWYNALRLMEDWSARVDTAGAPAEYAALAERARVSFNARFWNEGGGCLYDLVDGSPEEGACVRPNQLLSISLPHPVLDPGRWNAVLETVERELLTPVGLRTLSRASPLYKPRYDGDLRSRDAAYHQGTVWAWLIGPYIDARLKARPADVAGARACLRGLVSHLGEACIGSISEIFDAEEPFTPRGCVAQAWSVAEVLRAWTLTGGGEP
ncbi:MAG: amylo-alpha-1,6-glucosidase, partial [Elusimicrobiota bacterium]|nr:amylo-alpha-1,6-glucosidase [Elusimicrobiota bacterium]